MQARSLGVLVLALLAASGWGLYWREARAGNEVPDRGAASPTNSTRNEQDSRLEELERRVQEQAAELARWQAEREQARTPAEEPVRLAEPVVKLEFQHHENGAPKSRVKTIDGVAMGQWEAWHANGQKSELGTLLEGKRTGRWQFWNPQGELTATGRYLDGERIGTWTVIENGVMQDMRYDADPVR
ncbi:MAG: hypothetical protein HUU28_14770 [Planctomycetaceae bacterium]|nr:hypothetical protein [Planctomycetaceae bacterium]